MKNYIFVWKINTIWKCFPSAAVEVESSKGAKKQHLTKLCNEMLKFNVWLTNNTEKCTKKMENHGEVFDRNNKKHFTTNAMKQ